LTSGRNDTDSLDEQKNNRGHVNKNLNVFVVCLIIASVMWLMIKLSDNYIHNAVFYVNYKGIQKNKLLIPSSDTLVIASVQSSGYDIIYDRLLNKTYSLQLDLNQYPAKVMGKFFEITIETPSLSSKLASFFKSGEKIISLYPSTIKVRLERAYSKKVPVKADVDIKYKKQYNVYKHIFLKPDSVVITGSKKIIDNISFVETEHEELSELSENTYLVLKLINPYSRFSLRYSAENVRMYIPVAEFTEEYVDIPLTYDSLPNDYQLIAYPDKVRCYFVVSIPDHNKVSVDSFKAGFKESDLFNSRHNVAKVILKKVPSYARIERIEPDNVEYLIRKK